MTTSAPPRRRGRSRAGAAGRDTVRVTVVAISALVAVVGGFIGSGAVVGTPIDEAAGGALSASASLVAPAGPAFSIWSVIYAGLLALAVYQLLPGQRADVRQRRTGWWVAASLLLNAAWILTAQAGSVTGALVVIALLLVSLVVALARLIGTRPASALQALLLDGVVGLYLGWVSIATVANAAAALVADAGWEAVGAGATVWTVVVLLVAAGIGAGLAVVGHGRIAPALSLSWGLAWIAVARIDGAPVSVVAAIFAGLAALAVIGSAVLVRVQRRPLRR